MPTLHDSNRPLTPYELNREKCPDALVHPGTYKPPEFARTRFVTMRIEAVYLRGFPPFADTQLSFPAVDAPGKGELHLFVGQNGTGKTRLLCLLAAALGNRSELDARMSNGSRVNGVVVCRFGEESGVWGTASNHCWWSDSKVSDRIVQQLLKGENGPGQPSPNLLAPSNRLKEAGGGTALAFRGTGRVSDAQIAAMNPVKVGEQAQWLSFDHVADTDLVIGQSMANIKMGAAMESMSAPNGQPGRAMKIATTWKRPSRKSRDAHFTLWSIQRRKSLSKSIGEESR